MQVLKELSEVPGPHDLQRRNPDGSRKVQAISNFQRPANISELRRFLGMVNHVGKFESHMADTAKPLRDLVK